MRAIQCDKMSVHDLVIGDIIIGVGTKDVLIVEGLSPKIVLVVLCFLFVCYYEEILTEL